MGGHLQDGTWELRPAPYVVQAARQRGRELGWHEIKQCSQVCPLEKVTPEHT